MHRLVFHRLKILPLTCGTVWLITLLTLLIYWLAEGRPRYPGQTNPSVAFISDIGAFRLQPLFITGGILSSLLPHPHPDRHLRAPRAPRAPTIDSETGGRAAQLREMGFRLGVRVRGSRLSLSDLHYSF